VPSHVMILGCGRSGTSIFGELFDGLDGYRYRSEPPFEEVMTADYSNPTAFKVPRESALWPSADGLSFPLPDYLSKAPEAKIFWIVRHPLDAISSLRVGIAKNWGHHPRPPDWQEWLARPLLEQCAHHWAFLNTAGFAQVAHCAIVVRFEDLIADPVRFATEVCRHVGVDPNAVSPHLQRWTTRVQDTNNAHFVEAVTSRSYSRHDHERRVGRWRENLTMADLNSVWPIMLRPAQTFGYPTPPLDATTAM
jgi:sulfotransferase family protein